MEEKTCSYFDAIQILSTDHIEATLQNPGGKKKMIRHDTCFHRLNSLLGETD